MEQRQIKGVFWAARDLKRLWFKKWFEMVGPGSERLAPLRTAGHPSSTGFLNPRRVIPGKNHA